MVQDSSKELLAIWLPVELYLNQSSNSCIARFVYTMNDDKE